MATPLTQKQKDGLAPLSSSGALSGTGDGSFQGGATTTGFTNAQDLLAANQGKGQEMFNAIPGSTAQDENDATSGLADLKGYDPNSGLSSSTQWDEIGRTKTAGADGMTTTNVSKTPTTTTNYSGWSGADVDDKANKLRGLKTKFDGFGDLYGQQDGAAELRGQALAQNIQKTQPLYAGNKGQGAFDSFLVESEAAPSIQQNSDRIKSLIGKFDGFDSTVDGLKNNINTAQSKVGTSKGPAQVTDSWSSKADPIDAALASKTMTDPMAVPGAPASANPLRPQIGWARNEAASTPAPVAPAPAPVKKASAKAPPGTMKDALGNPINILY